MDFFEFHEKVNQRGGRPAEPAGRPREVLSVGQFTQRMDAVVKRGFPGTVYVRGEVSNAKPPGSSGHVYFSMKDSRDCLDCVMYRDDAQSLRFSLEDGMEVVAGGRVAAYGPRSKYQLKVERVEPVGHGALEVALRQLRAKLEAEGLMARRRTPIPRYPQNIVIITSKESAAIQDMFKVLRKHCWLRIMVADVRVQGEGAGERMARVILAVNQCAEDVGGVDVIILGRGGGSLEDLWEFNSEMLARAVAGSRIPIVTGIGHEIDVSLADLVADYHAHTPTEAAAVVVQHWKLAGEVVEAMKERLRRELRHRVDVARQRVVGIERHEVFRRPLERINLMRQLLDEHQRRLALAIATGIGRLTMRVRHASAQLEQRHPRHVIRLAREKMGHLEERLRSAVGLQLIVRRNGVEALERQLNAVGPEQVLKRGYSITTLKKGGVVVKSAAQVKAGEKLVTRLADGVIESEVGGSRQMSLFE